MFEQKTTVSEVLARLHLEHLEPQALKLIEQGAADDAVLVLIAEAYTAGWKEAYKKALEELIRLEKTVQKQNKRKGKDED